MSTQKTDGSKRKWNELIEMIQSLSFNEVIPNSRNQSKPIDLSAKTLSSRGLNKAKTQDLSTYIFKKAAINHGGYLEKRDLYSSYPEYCNSGRDVHLGVDIWTVYQTEVICPLDAEVFSAHDNSGIGNYGPTVILKHSIKGIEFFTLYGHLTTSTIETLQKGQLVLAGQSFGLVGHSLENGNWPPHLHFQLILDLQGNTADFPGVCSEEELHLYKSICPDPNSILDL